MNKLHQAKGWIKQSSHPLARCIRVLHAQQRGFEIPPIKAIYLPLRFLYQGGNSLLSSLTRILFWTPLFKTRLASKARRLLLYGGMPLVQGPLRIEMGNNCRISGQTTFTGRWSSPSTPLLSIGNNVGIAWQTTIAVGSRVILGDNVRIAGRGFLAGYPGHPVDAADRAAGKPDTDDQVGDIILEADVWLGSGVTVMKGVTIGQGTIVATGSVVTHSLPPGVLAGGVPARVIRPLSPAEPALTDDLFTPSKHEEQAA